MATYNPHTANGAGSCYFSPDNCNKGCLGRRIMKYIKGKDIPGDVVVFLEAEKPSDRAANQLIVCRNIKCLEESNVMTAVGKEFFPHDGLEKVILVTAQDDGKVREVRLRTEELLKHNGFEISAYVTVTAKGIETNNLS